MKQHTNDRRYLRAAWLWVVGFGLFRLLYAGLFPLVPDETNYWQWGRHLAWGYHDQAPLIGWSIRFFCEILGNTETAVRLPSVAAMFLASVYLLLIADRWFGARAAFATAVFSQGILLFNVGGLLATADGLQAAGWAGASYHVARAYEEDSWRQWLAGGAWFGFGLLAKFTMVIFLPCAFLYGLFSSRHRPRLAGVRPYAGVLLGLLMFAPVICWNAANDWNSVRHVAYLGGANAGLSFHLKYLGEYIASQAGLVSPLALFLILMSWHYVFWRKPGTERWTGRYLFWTSLPMVAGFAVLSLHTRVYGNWPGAGYLTASVLAAAFFGRPASGDGMMAAKTGGLRRLWPWTIGLAYCMTALVLVQAVWRVIPLSPDLDRPSREIYGWRELGARVEEVRQSMPSPAETFLFGQRYQIASELAFYTPGQPETVSINRWSRPNVYDYWWEESDLLGRDAVGVTRNPDRIGQLRQAFERVEPAEQLPVYRKYLLSPRLGAPEPVQVFYIFRCYGFKEGLRWRPRDRSDIRAVADSP